MLTLSVKYSTNILSVKYKILVWITILINGLTQT